jgi:hypothetical protein
MSDNQIIAKLNSKIEALKAEYRSTYGDENLANLRNQIEALKTQVAGIRAFANS